MSKAPLPCLTALRGMAALCVLLHHFTGHLLPAIGELFAESSDFLLRSYLWVDFFFVLSGFLLAYLYRDAMLGNRDGSRSYRRFLRARFARTYPLHLVTLLLVLGLNLAILAMELRSTGLESFLASEHVHELRFYGHDTVWTFLQHLFLLNSLHSEVYSSWNSPSWSIGAEWVAYVLFPLLLLPGRAAPVATMVACLPVALLGTWGIAACYGDTLDVAGLAGVVRCLLECSLGIGLYLVFQAEFGARLLATDGLLAIVILAAVAALHFDLPDQLAVAPLALLVLAGASNRGAFAKLLDTRPFLFLGQVSYSVYMIHWVFLLVVLWVWRGAFDEPFGASFGTLQSFAVLLACVGLMLLAAFATYRWIEVPWRRRLRAQPIPPPTPPPTMAPTNAATGDR